MKIIIRQFGSRQTPDDVLDMTPDGAFIEPPRPSLSDRLISWALLAGGAMIALGGAVLAIWFALLLVPFVLAAALIGYAAFRWYIWRLRNSAERR